jgi:DNA-binding NarL/FixJ family response regulator
LIPPAKGSISECKVAEPLRVLLADDNPAILEVVRHMLQKEFVVIGALVDASAVVEQAPELKPDVLILDISMGELNGFEIAQRLRAKQCFSKIIFLSVHEEFEFIRAAFDAGASGYVFKSRMNTDLRAALEAIQCGKVFIPHAPISQ